MKQLIIIVLCLFSISVFCTTTVQAAECHSGMSAKELKEKKCYGVLTDDGDMHLFQRLWSSVYFLFGFTSFLLIKGFILLKDETKQVKGTLCCLSPLIPICLALIIKTFENLM